MITRNAIAKVQQIEVARLKLTRAIRSHTKESLSTLLSSMSTVGLLSPIGVLPEGEDGCREVLYGYARAACARELGWTHIEAKEFARETKPGESLRIASHENAARKDMSFLEQWEMIHQYSQMVGVDFAQSGKELGFKQSKISKLFNCYKRIPDGNKKLLSDAKVGFSKVFELSQANEPLQSELVRRTIAEGLTREQIRAAIRPTKIGLRKLEFQCSSGQLNVLIPRNASPQEATSAVLKAFVQAFKQSLKLTSDSALIAQALKERSHVV